MPDLKDKIDHYAYNAKALKDVYKWRFDRASILIVSAQFAQNNQRINLDLFHEVSEKLKSMAGPFTTLLRTQRYFLAASLIIKTSSPIDAVERLVEGKKQLSEAGFKNEAIAYFLSLMFINKTEVDHITCVKRANRLYKLFKREHPFVLNNSIFPFVLLLVRNRKDIDLIAREVEDSYQLLESRGFKAGLELHQMSQLLVLRSQPGQKSRTIFLFNYFNEAGYKLKPDHYISLSLLALTGFEESDISTLVDLTKTCVDRIGYRSHKVLHQQLAMQLLMSDYLPDDSELDSELINLSQMLMEAQQISLITQTSIGGTGMYNYS